MGPVRRGASRFGAAFLAFAGLLGAPSKGRADPIHVRVVTFNAWDMPAGMSDANGPRIEKIGAALGALKPDVVCFQELWIDQDAERVVADLAAAGLVHARRYPSGLVGSGLQICSRFPIKESSFLRYRCGGQAWKLWHCDFYGGKGIARVRVETPLGPLDVADTHMHAVYGDEAEYLATRTAEALEAAEFLVEKDGVPLVLAGDLNARKGSLPFELLAHGARFTELPAEDRIDWVIARSGATLSAKVTSYERALAGPVALSDGQTRTLSDHEARLAVVTLERAPRVPPREAGGHAPYPRADEAFSVLESALAASSTRSLGEVLPALILVSLIGMATRRKKPERVWLRRPLLLCALAATGVLLALAFLFEPRERDGLRDAQRRARAAPL